jgi:hypothetical protein
LAIQVYKRILWRQLSILMVLFVAVLFWVSRYLEGILLNSSEEAARRSNLVVVRAVEASMRAEQSHEVWSRVVERIPDRDMNIAILDPEGAVFSSPIRSAGDKADRFRIGCAEHAIRRVRKRSETALIEDRRQALPGFRAPLRNSGCAGPATPVAKTSWNGTVRQSSHDSCAGRVQLALTGGVIACCSPSDDAAPAGIISGGRWEAGGRAGPSARGTGYWIELSGRRS